MNEREDLGVGLAFLLDEHDAAQEVGVFLVFLEVEVVQVGEQLTRLQWLATVLAALGVLHEIWRAGGMSWETWLVALGYTLYFVLRRHLRTDHLGGHWLDMMLLIPAALWFVLRTPSSFNALAQHPNLWGMVTVLGIVSAVALALYMAASRLLPLGLFGLLSYLEPALLALAALALGESMEPGQWPSYGPIFAAVAVLIADGVLRMRQHARTP